MPISVTCPSCSRRFNAPDEAAGKKAKCPNCGGLIEIAARSSVEEILDAEEELRVAPVDEGTQHAGAGDELKPCPMCGEMIQKSAVKCRFCGEIFDPLLKQNQMRGNTTSANDDLTTAEWVVAIVCSGIGCIMGIIWMIQGKPKGKKMFLVSLIASFAWGAINAMLQSTVTNRH